MFHGLMNIMMLTLHNVMDHNRQKDQIISLTECILNTKPKCSLNESISLVLVLQINDLFEKWLHKFSWECLDWKASWVSSVTTYSRSYPDFQPAACVGELSSPTKIWFHWISGRPWAYVRSLWMAIILYRYFFMLRTKMYRYCWAEIRKRCRIIGKRIMCEISQ